MKIKMLSAAVAMAVSTSAMALVPGVDSVDLEINISGATAVEKQILSYVNQICDTNTLDTFTSVGGGAEAWFCTVPAANTDIGADRNVIIRKENGGSSTGVAPVSNNQTVNAIDFSTCLDDGSSFGDVTAGDNIWGCSGTFVQVPSMVGVSDVEPELFKLEDNGSKNVNAAALNNVFPVNAQTFGIIVSPGLRDALQAAQGLTVGSDDVADMPSLSSAIIANIFAGAVSSWNDLGGIVPAGVDERVNVCPRKPGSGTQAQFNAFYMKNACAYRGAGDLGFLGFNTADDSDGIINDGDANTGNIDVPSNFLGDLPAPYIYENKGSSDLGKCVTNISADLVDVAGVGTDLSRWAIGIQSLEKVDEGRVNRNNFKYVAVDGVTPLLKNVASGLYHNWAAASIQWRGDVLTPGSELETLALAFVKQAQSVDSVKDFNNSLRDDAAGSTNDNRPGVGLYRAPEILDATETTLLPGETADMLGVARVGSLVFAGTIDPSTNLVVTSDAVFDPSNPVIPFNKGLSNPSSCKVANMVDVVDVSNQN